MKRLVVACRGVASSSLPRADATPGTRAGRPSSGPFSASCFRLQRSSSWPSSLRCGGVAERRVGSGGMGRRRRLRHVAYRLGRVRECLRRRRASAPGGARRNARPGRRPTHSSRPPSETPLPVWRRRAAIPSCRRSPCGAASRVRAPPCLRGPVVVRGGGFLPPAFASPRCSAPWAPAVPRAPCGLLRGACAFPAPPCVWGGP